VLSWAGTSNRWRAAVGGAVGGEQKVGRAVSGWVGQDWAGMSGTEGDDIGRGG